MKSVSLSTCLQRRFVQTRMDFTFLRHLAPLHVLSLTFPSKSSSLQWVFEDFLPSPRRKSLQTNYFLHQVPFLSCYSRGERKVLSKNKVYRANNLEQKVPFHPLSSIDCSFNSKSFFLSPSSAFLCVASGFIVQTQSGDLFERCSATAFNLASFGRFHIEKIIVYRKFVDWKTFVKFRTSNKLSGFKFIKLK
jgi:hypothetical protein